jgi:hypothetical protein
MGGITIGKNWVGGTAANRAYGAFPWTVGKAYSIAIYGLSDGLEAIVMDVQSPYGGPQAWSGSFAEYRVVEHVAISGYVGIQFQYKPDKTFNANSLDGVYIVISEVAPTVYPISLTSAGTVYGGTLDVTTGVLVVTHGFIASYAGESLPGAWISDRDVYAAGTAPTMGAQVCYALATPTTYYLTPTEITTLLGNNTVWSDAGSITLTYRADLQKYFA